jgi:hypothetical protein
MHDCIVVSSVSYMISVCLTLSQDKHRIFRKGLTMIFLEYKARILSKMLTILRTKKNRYRVFVKDFGPPKFLLTPMWEY